VRRVERIRQVTGGIEMIDTIARDATTEKGKEIGTEINGGTMTETGTGIEIEAIHTRVVIVIVTGEDSVL
jgi:hypothetical protein